MSPLPSQPSSRNGPVPFTSVRIRGWSSSGSSRLWSHAVSSIARAGEAILVRNAASTSHSSNTTVRGSRAKTRRSEPSYGPKAGSALAGSSHGAAPSTGYAISSKGPVLGRAVGNAVEAVGPGRSVASGPVVGAGPPQPTITMIAAMPAASSRPGRGRRDIGS